MSAALWRPAQVWLGLGLNVPPHGWRWQRLLVALGHLAGVRVAAIAPVSRNPAQGPGVRGYFWNSVARLEVEWSPLRLLEELQCLELRLGRRGGGDRPADLDVLLWCDAMGWRRMRHPRLVLPHPRMRARIFVREPWRRLAAVDPPSAVAYRHIWPFGRETGIVTTNEPKHGAASLHHP